MNTKINQDDRLLARLKAQLLVKFKSGLRDERGATAVFFAFGLLLLAPATLGLVDVYLSSTQRAQLQDALDTATLYAARSDKTTSADLKIIGDAALKANLKLPEGQKLVASNFVLDGIKLVGTASVTAPGIGPQLWAKADLTADSEVLRNSNNVEVAMVLDTTGSMSNSMTDLRTAAKDLVDLVVKDQQPPAVPYYTKVALVPYSVGVNLGGYADQARGTLAGDTAIKSISSVSSKVQIESVGHGLQTGERVLLSGISGSKIDGNSMNKDYTVTFVSVDKFTLDGVDASKLSGKYSGPGKAQCTREGCMKFRFQNAENAKNWKIFGAGTCASERIGAQAYTDASPGTASVGRLYDGGSGNACTSAEIVPLSTDKTMLKNKIGALTDAGSTAGQIGLAWGWYMVSPEWSTLWTGASTPAAYSKPQTLKVVVLMTDGAFNSPYCKGVIAKDAGSGSGNASDHIECNATNGDPFAQAKQLCTNMKLKGVIVYTVGFNVGSDAKVTQLMDSCATSAQYVYKPANGAALKVAFRAIAQDINSLRISK